jgi:prepilin-type N-terminal cleavage/methylation domain-containing protein
MTRIQGQDTGFTLIEMMVTLAVLSIFALIALPSYESLRQRSALRGASEQALGFWNQARFEAAKRNQLVKVAAYQATAGGPFCLGAATTTSLADVTPCDCLSAAPTTNVCDVSRFPTNQSEWSGVSLSTVTLGGSTVLPATQPAIIEPKRTGLTSTADVGSIGFLSPSGPRAYRLNLRVDRFGRGFLCESTAAVDRLSDYGSRRCDP